ncbi:acetylcholine receptor subunit alpha-1-B-like [Liolophura sinensis]|uniref:acetylcholine receptor subunit alpha-1-B-like n=1 Tax=Liolophura sinensis TaxID=3198878 RepID=UPI003158743D
MSPPVDIGSKWDRPLIYYFLGLQWSDETLKWDPAKYGGQTFVLANPDDIWKPDITVINGAKDFIYARNLKFLVELKWTGRTDWSPASMFETTCPVDVTLYPFDTQTCEILIACWMYNYKTIKMTPRNSSNILYFGESGEWIFSSSKAKYDLVEYNGSNFSVARISFTFQRRRAFYVINVIVPVLCLSLLNTLVFLVPPESGEKMSLSITVVLAYSVYLSIVSADMPGTSNSVSYLAIYLIFVLVMGMIAVFMSAFVLWIFHAKARQLDEKHRHFSLRSCSSQHEENRTLSDTDHRHILTDRAKYIQLTTKIDRLSFWSFLALTLAGFITLMALLLS